MYFNHLNAKLNPICHLLALLGGATIVVVSKLRVKEAWNENWCRRKEILFLRHLCNSLRRDVFKKFHAIFGISCSQLQFTACKEFPWFLSSIWLVACNSSVCPTFPFTVTHLMFTNCCLYPLCFPTYSKAPEWHSAYQNTGKSPHRCSVPPDPFFWPSNAGLRSKERIFLIKALRCFRFLYVPRK
jgi:hypothetical protein